jgi:hypothetical protein
VLPSFKSGIGTKRTCRAGLAMSVHGVERKPYFKGGTSVFDPQRKWRLITLRRNDDLNGTVLIPLAECGWRVRAPNFHQNRLS